MLGIVKEGVCKSLQTVLDSYGRPAVMEVLLRQQPLSDERSWVTPMSRTGFLQRYDMLVLSTEARNSLDAGDPEWMGSLKDVFEYRLSVQKELLEAVKEKWSLHLQDGAARMLSDRTFKDSTLKRKPDYEYLALNCHVHNMTAFLKSRDGERDDEKIEKRLYDHITVGAFAAHSIGFGQGGAMTSIEELKDLIGKLLAEKHCKKWCLLMKKFDNCWAKFERRLSVIASQALIAIIAAFRTKLGLMLKDQSSSQNLSQLIRNGFLVVITSLLSSFRNEAAMLEDTFVAVKLVQNLDLLLLPLNIDTGKALERGLTFTLPHDDLPTLEFSMCPSSGMLEATLLTSVETYQKITASGRVRLRVYPILINQGVNEWQSMASLIRSKKLKVQEDVNSYGVELLKQFYRNYKHRVLMPIASLIWEEPPEDFEELMISLSQVRTSRGGH
jgi:hypothetical protein